MYRIEDIKGSVEMITKAILKNTASVFTFQELLEKRNQIADDIELQIDPFTSEWGIKIKDIYFKGIPGSIKILIYRSLWKTSSVQPRGRGDKLRL